MVQGLKFKKKEIAIIIVVAFCFMVVLLKYLPLSQLRGASNHLAEARVGSKQTLSELEENISPARDWTPVPRDVRAMDQMLDIETVISENDLKVVELEHAKPEPLSLAPAHQPTSQAEPASVKVLYDNFDQARVIEEASNKQASQDQNWWLNSGAWLKVTNGIAATIQDPLLETDPWRQHHLEHNPSSTDDGAYPQNILRLITQDEWRNQVQEVYFKILKTNLTQTPKRNKSNGVLLFSRYIDSDNLYYAGLRVDGAAVIKKKFAGEYYTLAYDPFTDQSAYTSGASPNLIPHDKWMGLKSEIIDLSSTQTKIRLFADWHRTGVWTLLLEALDEASEIRFDTTAGSAGIRSDFMDLVFDNYSVAEIMN